MRMHLNRKLLVMAAIGLLALGATQVAGAMYMPLKAKLSVYLIEHAWQQTLHGKKEVRPWPWMDSSPVARLQVPRLGKDMVVMRGFSGTVMAFAPGWHEGTVIPGKEGISLLAGHRDTHFRFMKDLKLGDRIELETVSGDKNIYEVSEMEMLEKPQLSIPAAVDEGSVLVLSTCYPFQQSLMGGTYRNEMRFVVVARKVTGAADIVS